MVDKKNTEGDVKCQQHQTVVSKKEGRRQVGVLRAL